MKRVFLLLLQLTAIDLLSQNDSLNIDLLINNYLEENVSDEENEELYELIEELLNNPKDLNEADKAELTLIPWMDMYAAESIINYRDKNNRFYSTKELFLIDSLNASFVRSILPFVTIKSSQQKNQLNSVFKNIKIINRTRIYEKNDPGEEVKYNGTNTKFYERIMIAEERGNLSLLIEKDPGETNLNDYLSLSLELFPHKNIPQLVIGDYSVEFGQGLVIWRPYSFLKGSDVISPFNRKARHLIANKSANEINVFRGIGTRFLYSPFSLHLFFSNNYRDAAINEEGLVTSISQTGYHRTGNEISKKHNLNEKAFGGIISYESNNFSLEFLSYILNYSRNIFSSDKDKLNGQNFFYNSLSYQYKINNLLFTGECAYNKKSFAGINNIQFHLSRNVRTILSLRYYPRNFSTMYGNAIGEKSGSRNETAIYAGVSVTSRYGNLSAYYDIFNFPFTSNEFPFSSGGKEFLLYFNSRYFENFGLQVKYKYERKELYSTDITALFPKIQHKLRFVLSYQPKVNLNLKTGVEWTTGQFDENLKKEKGYLFYEDIKYIFNDLLLFNSRICFFNTDSYNSRIYMYENDLRGVFTNLPFYDEGFKWYMLVVYKPFKWLNLSLKYSNHYDANAEYENNNNIYYGKNISRISLQIDNYYD